MSAVGQGARTRRAPLLAGRVSMGQVGWAAAAAACSILAGAALPSGRSLLYLAGAALALLVLLWPERAVLLLLVGLLASGRQLSHVHVTSSLYIVEALLALILAGVVLQAVVSGSLPHAAIVTSRMFAFVLTAAAAGLAVKTSGGPHSWLPNFAIVYYLLFMVVAATLTPSERLYKALFYVAMGGASIALVLVTTGHAGSAQDVAVGNGLTRIAHGSFALPFGIAPLVLYAAVRERLIRSRWLLAAIPFVLLLVLLAQRAAWLGFVVAAAMLVDRRFKVKLVLFGAAAVAGAILFLGPAVSQYGGIGNELARARSIRSTADPNNHFRLEFAKNVVGSSLRSPLFGQGFDPYPDRLVPAHSAIGTRNDPHNSFAALAYRIGPLPLVALVWFIFAYVIRGVRVAVEARSATRSAAARALTAVVTYVGILSAFNVFLEFPYAATLFWVPVGLLVGLALHELQADTEAAEALTPVS